MKQLIKELYGIIKIKLCGIKQHGKKNYISHHVQVLFGKNVKIGNKISIRPYSFIACNNNSSMIIGDNCDIGNRNRIVSSKKVIINEAVLTGPNVFISDNDHVYADITTPVMFQGGTTPKEGITIGSGTWIGTNAVIVGDVKIGKNCVVAANSVISNASFPDYCVIAGAPARIVKIYDKKIEKWVKYDKDINAGKLESK